MLIYVANTIKLCTSAVFLFRIFKALLIMKSVMQFPLQQAIIFLFVLLISLFINCFIYTISINILTRIGLCTINQSSELTVVDCPTDILKESFRSIFTVIVVKSYFSTNGGYKFAYRIKTVILQRLFVGSSYIEHRQTFVFLDTWCQLS